MYMEKAPVKHNRLRRMEKHDYTSACIYLVTLRTAHRNRVLGSLVGDSPNHAAKRITRSQCLDMNEYAADLANVTLKCNEQDEEEFDERNEQDEEGENLF